MLLNIANYYIPYSDKFHLLKSHQVGCICLKVHPASVIFQFSDVECLVGLIEVFTMNRKRSKKFFLIYYVSVEVLYFVLLIKRCNAGFEISSLNQGRSGQCTNFQI